MDKKYKPLREGIKDIKLDKGAILDDASLDEVKKGFIAMSDDELLFTITVALGRFGLFVRSMDDVMKAYGAAVGYFLAEEEAKARNLYP